MSAAESRDWYALSRATGVGPRGLWKLFDRAHREGVSLADAYGGRVGSPLAAEMRRLAAVDAVPDELAALEQKRVQILHPEHPEYPEQLAHLAPAFGIPPVLLARGHLPLLRARSVAIVGSRAADERTLGHAASVAESLAREGFNIVSGYARGIDSTAHASALKVGGTTTIVLSLGILNFEARQGLKPLFSPANTLVLSQFHPRARWMARNAMARNKLVCALSRAVVVIASGPERDESGRASGTYDAAATAQAMGIPVFVLSPRAFAAPPPGNAALIQRGCETLEPETAVSQIGHALVETGHMGRTQYALL